MTRFVVFFTCCLFAIAATGQNRPSLPADFFDQYTHTLPAGFDLHNETMVQAEVSKVAASLLSYLQEGEKKYSPDSNDQYDLASITVVPALLTKNYALALEKIRLCRVMKPAPAYRLPFALVHEAWCRAAQRHAEDGSTAFKQILQEELRHVHNSLDGAFRDDIVNAQKGNFTTASVQVNFRELEHIVEQSGKSANKLPFGNVYDLLEYYFRYYMRKQYQPEVEALLYQLSPARVEESQVMIPMRDGVRLSGFLYRNAAATEKVPVVVSLSPYPSGNEGTRGNVFATNGYIYLYVDCRGRRKSEGEFFPYEHDARDYYDIIDWASKQPWCNGQVATSGGSYLGFAQWQAIRKPYKHPALKAINPMVAVGFGVDFPRFANQFYSYILQWAEYVSGKELDVAKFRDDQFWNRVNYEMYKKRIPFAKLDSVAGLPNPYFQKWVKHPDFDGYWQSILPNAADYAALDIPVLTLTGYYDADQLGAMYYFNQHHRYGKSAATSKHYMLIGPYDHGGPQWQPGPMQAGLPIEKEAMVPIYKYVIWWYDWVLKGKAKPAFIKDKINYFVTGTGQWKSTSSFKKITRDTLNLYLSEQAVQNPKRKEVLGLVNTFKGTPQTVVYRHDIAQALDSSFVYAKAKPGDDSLYMTSPYNLVFESAPLDKDIILTDKITAALYLSLNVPDGDFSVSIYEIEPDGKSNNLATAYLRSRYRNGGEHPALLKPGQIALHRFEEVFIYIKKIKKGHKLRFTFESINSPNFEKNYGFGGVVSNETTSQPRVIEATIHTGPKYPSRIMLPYTTE